MKIFYRITGIIALITIAIIAFAAYFVNRSKPVYDAEIDFHPLTQATDVRFDDYGIPHIYAANAADAYRTFGFVHAQDRLFQMELMRRIGHGRLAEVLGADLASTDAFFRTLGTHRHAQTDAARFATADPAIQEVVNAYLEGVNRFIARGRLPLEFTLAGIDPEPFEVVDIYAIAAYMAYSFAYALRTDPVVDFMTTHLDSVYLADFDLAYAKIDSSSTAVQLSARALKSKLAGFALIDGLPLPVLQGSNSWALAPSRSASGSTMLANDTHIKYGAPAVWYEAHLNYPGVSFYGNFIAGIPVALVGHSLHHAWGVTMFEDDDSDFFIQKFSKADSSLTQFGESQSKPVAKYQERIAIKGAPDSTFTVYETENGPIINAFLPGEHDQPIAMYWNYTCIENELVEAFYEMKMASDLHEFGEAVAKIGSPGLNITYADAEGNIAGWACSKLIERPSHQQGKSFLRGYAPEDAYLGFYDFEHNPQVINPEKGYIVSANQFHDASEGMEVSGYYAPNNRYDRIDLLISQSQSASMEHMKSWITDVTSPAEAKVAHSLVGILQSDQIELSTREQEVLAMIGLWDGSHELHSIAPSIYYLWLYHVVDALFKDKLGDDYFGSFLGTHLFMRSYGGIIANEDSPWWDNVHTDDVQEPRSDIVLIAFRKSMETMQKKHGMDPLQWEWRKVHSTEHEHPLGAVAALKPFLNVGPFPSPGGHETVNNAGFRLNPDAEYRTTFGPAMRILIDFSDVSGAVSILPTGNSGNFLSDHYSDQAEMYIKGEFRPMLMQKESIEKGSNILRFKP